MFRNDVTKSYIKAPQELEKKKSTKKLNSSFELVLMRDQQNNV